MGISARIRPGIEAAPWVCVEVGKLEASYDALRSQNERLEKIEVAARNLVAQKGRHHTQQAYEQLAALLVPNADVTGLAPEREVTKNDNAYCARSG